MRHWPLTVLLGALALTAQPQPQPPNSSEDDDPGRGVARISVLNGDVSVRRGDSGDIIAAALNAPLVVTDRLLTGPQSRAELQFDWANMIRIGSNAEVRLSELEYRRYQIQIGTGTATFRVLRDSQVDVEISTPTVAVRPLVRGVYRIAVQEDGSTEITVRSGEAEVFTPRGSERLAAGNTMFARGSASDPEYQTAAPVPYDDWDRWNESRDAELERSSSYRYVSPDIYGAEDLDGHGQWVSAEGYGNVWAPQVDPGWAPYRYGRWTWVDYYGWTWVSYDSWGWAPYHYGRWFNAPGYGWCWWPGGIRERYSWRPALVAFFGFGGHGGFGATVGFGNVGWVPLAPHEPFYAWYGRGLYGRRNSMIVNNTTIINNTNIGNVYRNARVANGITAVDRGVFGRRAIGRGDLVHVNSGDLQGAGLVRGVLPVTPARESLRLADRSPAATGVPRVNENRQFYSRRQTAPVERVPFEQQRQNVERSAQRTFSGNGTITSTPPVTSLPGAGWRRPDTNTPRPAPSAPAADQNGWRRFGDTAPRNNGVGQPSREDRVYRSPERTTPPPAVERSMPIERRDRVQERTAPPSPPTAPPDRGGQRETVRPGVRDRSDNGWQRFGTSAGSDAHYLAAPSPPPPPDRSRADSSRAVRINPPIVRERQAAPPAPRSEPRSGGGRAEPTRTSTSNSGRNR